VHQFDEAKTICFWLLWSGTAADSPLSFDHAKETFHRRVVGQLPMALMLQVV
jgi:hypothetical protein